MKRLAIFLDGTWNTLDNNTNVWRLKSLSATAVDQRVYYSQGVGTQRGDAARGGITGYGIDREITDAYTWLIENFEAGDDIFIFGFSRGAYAARSLSGLIATCGILTPGAPLSIEQLYERYRRHTARTIDRLHAGPSSDLPLEEQWILKYCTPTDIKMVGVWDTVGSLGSPLSTMKAKVVKYRFLDTHLRLRNLNAFHALAIDEQRGAFEPTLWTRTTENSPGASAPPARPLAHVEQRWFVGAHANVGGGYPSDILAQRPLQWLMEKAANLGLRFRPLELDPQIPTAPITDSYEHFGPAVLRWFSHRFYRPIGKDPERGTTSTTERINETIDGSVFDRWRGNPTYRPPNLADWAERKNVDPNALCGGRLAGDATQSADATTS